MVNRDEAKRAIRATLHGVERGTLLALLSKLTEIYLLDIEADDGDEAVTAFVRTKIAGVAAGLLGLGSAAAGGGQAVAAAPGRSGHGAAQRSSSTGAQVAARPAHRSTGAPGRQAFQIDGTGVAQRSPPYAAAGGVQPMRGGQTPEPSGDMRRGSPGPAGGPAQAAGLQGWDEEVEGQFHEAEADQSHGGREGERRASGPAPPAAAAAQPGAMEISNGWGGSGEGGGCRMGNQVHEDATRLAGKRYRGAEPDGLAGGGAAAEGPAARRARAAAAAGNAAVHASRPDAAAVPAIEAGIKQEDVAGPPPFGPYTDATHPPPAPDAAVAAQRQPGLGIEQEEPAMRPGGGGCPSVGPMGPADGAGEAGDAAVQPSGVLRPCAPGRPPQAPRPGSPAQQRHQEAGGPRPRCDGDDGGAHAHPGGAVQDPARHRPPAPDAAAAAAQPQPVAGIKQEEAILHGGGGHPTVGGPAGGGAQAGAPPTQPGSAPAVVGGGWRRCAVGGPPLGLPPGGPAQQREQEAAGQGTRMLRDDDRADTPAPQPGGAEGHPVQYAARQEPCKLRGPGRQVPDRVGLPPLQHALHESEQEDAGEALAPRAGAADRAGPEPEPAAAGAGAGAAWEAQAQGQVVQQGPAGLALPPGAAAAVSTSHPAYSPSTGGDGAGRPGASPAGAGAAAAQAGRGGIATGGDGPELVPSITGAGAAGEAREGQLLGTHGSDTPTPAATPSSLHDLCALLTTHAASVAAAASGVSTSAAAAAAPSSLRELWKRIAAHAASIAAAAASGAGTAAAAAALPPPPVLDLRGRTLRGPLPAGTSDVLISVDRTTLRNGTLVLPKGARLRVTAADVAFSDLNIRGVGWASSDDEEEALVEVDGAGASARLERCHISMDWAAPQQPAGGRKMAKWAALRLWSGGVLVRGGGWVQLQDCSAAGTPHVGFMAIGAGSRLAAERCRAEGNQAGGFASVGGALAGRLQECLAHGNGLYGFVCGDVGSRVEMAAGCAAERNGCGVMAINGGTVVAAGGCVAANNRRTGFKASYKFVMTLGAKCRAVKNGSGFQAEHGGQLTAGPECLADGNTKEGFATTRRGTLSAGARCRSTGNGACGFSALIGGRMETAEGCEADGNGGISFCVEDGCSVMSVGGGAKAFGSGRSGYAAADGGAMALGDGCVSRGSAQYGVVAAGCRTVLHGGDGCQSVGDKQGGFLAMDGAQMKLGRLCRSEGAGDEGFAAVGGQLSVGQGATAIGSGTDGFAATNGGALDASAGGCVADGNGGSGLCAEDPGSKLLVGPGSRAARNGGAGLKAQLGATLTALRECRAEGNGGGGFVAAGRRSTLQLGPGWEAQGNKGGDIVERDGGVVER